MATQAERRNSLSFSLSIPLSPQHSTFLMSFFTNTLGLPILSLVLAKKGFVLIKKAGHVCDSTQCPHITF